jgi:hypothetical protein
MSDIISGIESKIECQIKCQMGCQDECVEKVHAVVARSTFRSQMCKKLTVSEHFWTFGCRLAWQAQGILHLVKSEQNVRVLWQFQKRWQVWDI